MLDQLRPIAVFQAVVEAGSFRGAAKKLDLSPAVVSHHISQLEKQLGVALLYRTTRRISLTDAGADLLSASQEMTQAAERGLQAVKRRANQPVGKLRITCVAALDEPPYIHAFTEFSRAFPKIEMSVNFNFTTIDLEGSEFDLAIRGSQVGLSDSSYKSRKVVETNLVVVASPTYLATRPTPSTLADLSNWDMVQFPPAPWSQVLAMTGSPNSIPPPRYSIVCDSYEAARHFVLDGLGFAAFDRQLIERDIKAGRVMKILPELTLPKITIWAVWPSNAGPESPAQRFVEFAATRWRDLRD